MTKKEIIQKMELEKETFDYALPQTWVDEVSKKTGDEIAPHFVWLYDKEGGLFGRPSSISLKGNRILFKIRLYPNLYRNAKYFQEQEKGE